MDQVWKKLYSDKNVLIYEGFSVDGKPYGVGRTFFENGLVYQEGIFDVKGLVHGREYYPNGKLRFEGTYEINPAYGPNYPCYGKCYDKDGYLYFSGELSIKRGGVGYPMVREPEEYGPVVQAHPKIEYYMFWDSDKKEALTRDGRHVEKTRSKSKELMKSLEESFDTLKLVAAAEAGNISEMMDLITIFRLNMQDEHTKALVTMYMRFLQKLCDAKVTAAYLMMGEEYASGKYVEKDIQKTLEWYDKAIEEGDKSAYEFKANLYYSGEYLPRDCEKALMYYRKAVDVHSKEIMEDYLEHQEEYTDESTFSDEELKEMVFDQALDQMTFHSLFTLGEIYRKGLCGEYEPELALKFYLHICGSESEYKELDDYYRLACYRAGVMIYKGEGCDNDRETALSFFREAESVTLDEDSVSEESQKLLGEILVEIEKFVKNA